MFLPHPSGGNIKLVEKGRGGEEGRERENDLGKKSCLVREKIESWT